MTTVQARPAALPSPATVLRWHRPLVVLAAVMAVCAVVSVGGLLFDDRELVGQPIWAKPLKFSVSIAVYALTWAWLVHQLTRFRRTAWWLGTVSAVMLGVEQVVIVAAVLRGTTSHFNVSTGLNTALWAAMGVAIGVVWVATFVVSLMLFASPGPDQARNLAVRFGALIAVFGMAVAFLMTIPSAAQIQDFDGVAGAHAVGVADGGTGLPFLGWSTTGGDLRIPHFIGMHALQAIPLFLLVLELLARRVPFLRSVPVRARLVTVAAVGWTAVTALLTWQALRGQSIVHPDGLTVAVAVVLLVGLVAGASWSLRARSTAAPDEGSDESGVTRHRPGTVHRAG
ncbi:uncharacterized membrane protein YhaH (DUF805 family) [Nakamurella flavida]|uniref:hypothetical protein n=1 Tax=Nakamurella flavida TaxID=363630 RepID=UPI001F0618F6|nr:hypothetical protein [Nakamurella flavida]MDP9778383.1 uncharacterized membrane protein YhaH (DUF805 family) [Nakamurella flavida]